MAQQTCDSDGNQYLFGYFVKGEGWCLPPHRFQIVETNEKQASGQYLTSNWFAKIVNSETDNNYVIIGVKNSFSYSSIKSLLDSAGENFTDYLTPEETEANITFKDIFTLTDEKINDLLTNGKNNDTFEIPFMGRYQDSILTLRGRMYKDGLYITLPSFVIKQ